MKLQHLLVRRRASVCAAVLAVLMTLSACGSNQEAGPTVNTSATTDSTAADADDAGGGEPIRIGILQTLSGPLAGNGEASVAGLQLYLDEHDGQLGGRPTELVVEDSEANPDVALRKVGKLIGEDRVVAIVGFGSSANALASIDALEDAQIPAIVTIAQANQLSGDSLSDYVFRTSHTYNQAGRAAGTYVAEEIASDDVEILTWDFVGGQDVAGAFGEAYEAAGGQNLTPTFTPFPATSDFQPYLSDITNSGRKAVYAFYGGGDSIDLVTQYASFGLKEEGPPLIGFPSLTDETVLDGQGEAADGVVTVAPYTWTLDNPTNEAFVEAYRAANDADPVDFAVYSWDAGQLLDVALENIDGEPDGATLAAAIADVRELDSPRGAITMNPESHNPDQPFYVREVQDVDGQLANVVIDEIGTITEEGSASS